VTTNLDPADRRHLTAAIWLGRRALGRAWPNPAVGCVLVKDGRVVGRGWTGAGGRPHAETEALRRAGEAAARGATAYVSLEPCAHHGKTPPCAEALAAAGVARVVAAIEDPDPRVSGRGLAMLRTAGVAVAVGLCREHAAEANAGFLTRVVHGRPQVLLKLATTLDGRIATRTGESRWITGAAARARAHLLRAGSDAVAIGVDTAIADDPGLDCRLPGMADRSPARVVFDSRLRLPPTSRLVRSAEDRPLWIIARDDAPEDAKTALEAAGCMVIPIAPGADGRPDAEAALMALGDRGLTRLMVEGGAALAGALLRRGLVDRIHWFRAPRLIGGDGLAAVGALAVEGLAEAPAYRRLGIDEIGDDAMETYARMAGPEISQ